MARLNKEIYMSESAKQLEQQLEDQLTQDLLEHKARKIIESIAEDKRFMVFQLLSLTYGTKSIS